MRNDADHVESGNSPPAEVRESEARASRIHSLLKVRATKPKPKSPLSYVSTWTW